MFRRIFSQIPLSKCEQAMLLNASLGLSTNLSPRVRHGAQILVKRNNLIQSKLLVPLPGTAEQCLIRYFETKHVYQVVDDLIELSVHNAELHTHLLTGFVDGGIVRGRALLPVDARKDDLVLF